MENVGALTLFSTLKSSSPPLTKIAREFALDLGRARFRPDLVQHIPGIVNKVKDVLSRRYQAGRKFELPSWKSCYILPGRRDNGWWKSLHVPSARSSW